MVALDKRGKDNVRFSQKNDRWNRRSILCDGSSEDRSTYRRRAGNHADRIREHRNRAGLYCITAGIDQYFEHNTPLHDGAIIVRGDRIVSATCYLPLSDNMGISKELGTRHRAAVGMSEVK